MKFYELILDHTEIHQHHSYHATLADAHIQGKADVTSGQDRPNVRITEIEVGSDKAAMLALVNAAMGTAEHEAAKLVKSRGRMWKLSSRGGLAEIITEPEDVGTSPRQ